jgi:hypothetical protein
MPRLALKPRYNEVEHVVNGDMESWLTANSMPGWTLVGGANGTLNRETDAFGGSFCMRIDKTASGAIYVSRSPAKPLIPGLYYRLAGAVRGSTAVISVAGRLLNVTRNLAPNNSGLWTGSANNFTSSAGLRWRRLPVWTRIPTTFSDADAYDLRIGSFTTFQGSAYLDEVSIIGPVVRPIHLIGLAALTYAAISRQEIVVTLTSPSGLEIDITRRVKLDGLGTITEGAEEEILQLTHGDMTLTLDDRDGFLQGLLADATATDRWELVVLGETGRAHGLKWDRIFAGVLDLPWSVSFDPREKETKIQVFSYSKELELISASTVRRSLSSKTASITSGTSQLVFLSGEAADLEIGDVVRVNDGQNLDDFTIARIIDASNAATTEAASRTFTSAFATVSTPFYHDKGPIALLNLIGVAAGASFSALNQDQPLADFPIATPFSIASLNLGGTPRSVVPSGGDLVATFESAYGTKRKTAASPTATWADGATSNTPQLDWTAYLNAEPSTIQEIVGTAHDTGIQAPDHTTGWVYYNVPSTAPNTWHLHRRLNSGGDTDLGAWTPTLINAVAMPNQAVEFDPTSNRVFLALNAQATDGIRQFRYYDGTFHDIDTAISGGLRLLRCSAGLTFLVLVDDQTNDLRIYNQRLATPRLDRVIPWGNATDKIRHWTFRTWGTAPTGVGARWMSVLFERYGETWVAIFDARGAVSAWSYVTSYRISSSVSLTLGTNPAVNLTKRAFQTVMVDGNGEEFACGRAGDEWFVLSTSYAGVVRYADFSALSCMQAIKALAVITNSYFDADRYRSFTFRPRPTALAPAAVQTIDDPLERTSFPIWEFFRSACKVTGTDASGKGFTIVQGVDGGNSKTLEISSPLIATPGMALAVAMFYAAYLNRVLRQEDIRIDEPEEPIRVLDVVTFDDLKWLVTDVQSNTRDREQSLRLFEVR